jgi:gamma-glutamyltranspeptidase
VKQYGLKALAAFEKAGLAIKFKEMKNGETRYSVMLPHGGAWTLTIAGETGAWQDAHFHRGLCELYQVVQGTMVVALSTEDYLVHEPPCYKMVLCTREAPITLGRQAHNVYLWPGTVIHTIQYGDPVGNPDRAGNDWWPTPALDEWSKRFDTKKSILVAAGGSLPI